MEKFTLRTAYTEVDLRARLVFQGPPGRSQGAASRLPADDGAASSSAAPSSAASGDAATARNADGDTFTLSVEAKVVRVEESLTVGTESGCGPHGRRHHGYARLADPEDVAARIAESWDGEFAARGGSRRAFAAEARARLDHWTAAGRDGSGMTVTHREFREEVTVRVAARLEQWTRDAGSDPRSDS